MSESNHTVNISTVTILKVVFVGLLLWFLWVIRDVLLVFIISIIISSAIDPVADFLYKRRVPRTLSVLLVYALTLGLLGLVIFLIIPPLTAQFEAIGQADVYDKFVDKIGIYRENLTHSEWGRAINDNIKQFAESFGGTIFNTTKDVINGIVAVLTIMVISLYLTAEENGMKNFVKHLAPYKHHAYVMRLVNKIQRKMGAWVLGQIILSLVIFGLTYIGLTVLKVEYALVLAMIAGLLEVIPFIGPIIAAVPAVILAFIQSPALALAVLVLYIIIQQLENHIVVPVVMSRSVGLNPVLVILGILIGGSLGGVIGALIAIPVMSGIQVFVTDMMEGEGAKESQG